MMRMTLTRISILFGFVILVSACTPKVEIVTREPITINLNVKIEHEIRVRVDKELDSVFSENKGLF